MRIAVFVIAAVLVIAAYFALRPKKVASPDAQVIEQLRKAGSNLSKVHTLDFNLDFPSESAARSALAQLELLHYSSEVHPLRDGMWTVTVHKPMRLDESAIGKVGSQLAQVAARFGGKYDGWGTSVEP